MYIGTIMHTDWSPYRPETTLVEAYELIESKGIDHLLVVNRKGRWSASSPYDLSQNWASPATALSAHELNYLLDKVQVQMIMVKTVVTVAPGHHHRAGRLHHADPQHQQPAGDGGRRGLVGIVTSTDVMAVLSRPSA